MLGELPPHGTLAYLNVRVSGERASVRGQVLSPGANEDFLRAAGGGHMVDLREDHRGSSRARAAVMLLSYAAMGVSYEIRPCSVDRIWTSGASDRPSRRKRGSTRKAGPSYRWRAGSKPSSVRLQREQDSMSRRRVWGSCSATTPRLAVG